MTSLYWTKVFETTHIKLKIELQRIPIKTRGTLMWFGRVNSPSSSSNNRGKFQFTRLVSLNLLWFSVSHYLFGIFNNFLEQAYHLFDLQIKMDIPFNNHITVFHTQFLNNEFRGITKKNGLLLVKKYQMKCFFFFFFFFSF
jgi:hypothetical protein